MNGPAGSTSSTPPERREANRAGIGVALVGALVMLIAAFLPKVESDTFGSIAKNTLIQNGDGWFLVVAAVGIAGAAWRMVSAGKLNWWPVALGLVAIGVAIYNGTGDRLLLISASGIDDVSDQGTAGIGVYAAGVGGLLAIFGGIMVSGRGQALVPMGADQQPGRLQKQCPECAETVLDEARVCKHCGHRFAPAAAAV